MLDIIFISGVLIIMIGLIMSIFRYKATKADISTWVVLIGMAILIIGMIIALV